MKDLSIKGEKILREIKIWVGMVVFAFLMNIYAIIVYDGKWSELFSQLHIVIALSIVLYVFLSIIRLIVFGIRRTLGFGKAGG